MIIVFLFFYIIIPEIGKQIQDVIGFTPNILDKFNNCIESFFTKLSNQYNNDFSTIFGIDLNGFGYSSENETQKEEKEEIVPSKLKIINETYTY